MVRGLITRAWAGVALVIGLVFGSAAQAQQQAPAITAPTTQPPPAISAPSGQGTPEQAPPISQNFQQALLAYTNGMAAFDKSDYDKAIQAFNIAIRNEPNNPQFHYMAAKTYEALGKFRGEWFHLRKAVRLQVNHEAAVPLFLNMWQTALDKEILNVGTPQQTVKAALGKPDASQEQAASTLWQYGFMGVELVDQRVVGVMDLRGSGALKPPQEDLDIALDGSKEWQLKQRLASRSDYKLIYGPAQASEPAEIVTHQRLIDVTEQMSVAVLAEKMRAGLEYEFPEVNWQSLETNENDILFAWWLDSEDAPQQYEIVRLLAGQNDIHRLTYTVRSSLNDNTEKREQWITRLRSAKLIPLEAAKQND